MANDRSYDLSDEDDPSPIPSWVPTSVRSLALERSFLEPRRPSAPRVVAWIMLLVGAGGVALGFVAPGTGTEVLLGALVILFAVRALVARRRVVE